MRLFSWHGPPVAHQPAAYHSTSALLALKRERAAPPQRPKPFRKRFLRKRPAEFSTQWKIFWRIFHAMEKLLPFFPHNGKSFRDFSTQWKECFHTVENSVLGLFSGVLGCSLGAVERSTRRPLSIVERDRPKRPRKRRPPQAVSALSRSRLGCGVGRGPFSGCEVGDFSRSQMRRGRCARSDL